MNEIDKQRAQRDAKRTVANRPAGSASRTQGILRHLGVELYREHKLSEKEGRSEASHPPEDSPDR